MTPFPPTSGLGVACAAPAVADTAAAARNVPAATRRKQPDVVVVFIVGAPVRLMALMIADSTSIQRLRRHFRKKRAALEFAVIDGGAPPLSQASALPDGVLRPE
jgi:hypothetical protein